jgi:PPP family 3-phenylpropionic acid transporter
MSWIKIGYFLQFSGFGLFIMYLNLHYDRIGLSPEQIGILASAYPLVGIFVNPFWGLAADAAADSRRILRGVLLAAGVFFASLFFLRDFGLIFLVTVLFAVCYSPTLSLFDALTLGTLSKRSGEYGRLRLWGSLGFVFPALVLWAMPGENSHLKTIFPLFLVFCALTALAISRCPNHKTHGGGGWLGLSALQLFRQPMFVVFIISVFLQKVSLSGYYSFFSIYLDDLGVPESAMGFFWGIGPVAEVAALFFASWYLPRLGLRRVLLISFLMTSIRLAVLAWAPPIPVLLANQLLHAFTFGTTHAASLAYLARKGNDSNRSSVQGLYTMLCLQMGMVLGHTLAGVLVERLGLRSMYASFSGVAMLGVIFFGLFFHRED